jgi:WD40 repeat protein
MAAPSTAGAETEFTVFISSPSDVDDERGRVITVLQQLNSEFTGRFKFNWISWPDAYYTASAGFQPQIEKPSACDIVVCVLWSRLGSELPPEFNRPDGTSRTGTEYEFEEALEAALQRQTPDILVYKKMQEEIRIKAGQVADQQLQLKALEAFWGRWFRDEKGHFTAGFDTFDSSKDFSEKLKRHLRLWLERRVKRTTWSISMKGSPYRRLESFDPDHADVFFGRRRAIRQVIARLQTRALDGCAFLVVVGMSGAGKSSMVKAGVVPWLINGFVASDVDAWRHCILRCDLILDDPTLHLAKALAAADCLPELAEGDYGDPEVLAKLMREAPSSAAAPITSALRRAGEAMKAKLKLDRVGKVQLVVVFDQLEALLLGPAAARDQLVPLMEAMARSSAVAVIATLRSDYYPEFQAHSGLMTLKTDGASFDLAPPNALEINEIIEGPARAAGLGLQQDGEQDLTALLNKAAAKPGSLPLLEFTLASLFDERDRESNTLLLKTYAELGGLEGAIAVEAERLVNAQPEALRAALSDLLLALVEVDEAKGAESASARTLSRSLLTDPRQIELADKLVEGRFLIADDAGAGPTLRLAHEALLRHWPRLSSLIEAEAHFLGARRRLQREALAWEREARHDDFLLPRGRRLTEASGLLADRRAHLEPETIAFIEASEAAAVTSLALERQRNRRRSLILFGASAVAIVLAVAAGLTIAAQQRAERVAVANDKADQLIAAGRYSEVIPLATTALPQAIDASASSIVQELVAKLQFAMQRNRLNLAIAGFNGNLARIAFDKSGGQILGASDQGEVGVWDANTGAPVLAYKDRGVGCCAIFDPTGARLVFASNTGAIQALDLKSAAATSLAPAGPKITTLAFDPSGAVLIGGAADGSLRLWNAANLAAAPRVLPVGGSIDAIAWCPQKRWFATLSDQGDLRILTYDGAQLAERAIGRSGPFESAISQDCSRIAIGAGVQFWIWNTANPSSPAQDGPPVATGRGVNSMAMDPAGHRLVTSSNDDESARLWDVDSKTQVAELRSHGRIQDLAFSPDGQRIASTAFDDWTDLWDGQTGAPLGADYVLRDGAPYNRKVAFSPNGERIATLSEVEKPSDPAIRIWDVRPKPAVSVATGLGGIPVGAPVRRLAFSPDKRWVVTAGADGLVHFWDAHTLARAADMDFIQRGDMIFDAEFDRTGGRLATASADGSTVVWTLASHQPNVVPITSPAGGNHVWASYAAFDPSQPWVVTSFADNVAHSGGARLFNLATGKPGPALVQDGREVWSTAFDSSGQHVLTASEAGTATIWDASTGKPMTSFANDDRKAVDWAGYSHHGDKVVTVSDDGAARLWDVASGRPIGGPLVNDPAGGVEMAAFSPDDTILVTSTTTGRLYYWDVDTQKLLGIQIVGDIDQKLYCVEFDPDGQRIAVGSHDGTVQLVSAHIDPTATVTAARQLAARLRPAG